MGEQGLIVLEPNRLSAVGACANHTDIMRVYLGSSQVRKAKAAYCLLVAGIHQDKQEGESEE